MSKPPRDRPPRPPGDLDHPDDETGPEVMEAPPVVATPTTTAPIAPPLRGRRRRFTLAATLLVAGAAAVWAVVYLSDDYRQARAFEQHAEAIFKQLSQGKAAEVYEEASPHMQQTLLVDKFRDLVERMNETLGRFVRVADVVDVDRASGVAGLTAAVALEIDFEQGATTGRLSFHRGPDGVWRLLGMNVEIPTGLHDKALTLEARSQRQPAPDVVLDLVHEIVDSVREDRAADVHARAAPTFQGSVTVEAFQAMLQSHQAELGNVVRVLAILSSALNSDHDRATVQAVLEYERGKTTGAFEFLSIGGTWRLLSLKIVRGEAGR